MKIKDVYILKEAVDDLAWAITFESEQSPLQENYRLYDGTQRVL